MALTRVYGNLITSGTLTGNLIQTQSIAGDRISLSSVGGNVFIDTSITMGKLSGTLPVANGGTGLTTLTANNVILGNGTSAPTFVAPGTSGNVLTSNGTTWASSTPASGTPTAITVANEASDTTCFPAFFTAATGDLGPKSNAGLTFNSNNGLLSATRVNSAAGADIASATTIDLTAATVNIVVITGTTPTTGLTMTAGQQMLLLPSSAWPMTFNATTMNINGAANYTCSAGDRVYCAKDLAGVIRVSVITQSGQALRGFSALGGTITYSGGYTIHTFTASGTFTPSVVGTVDYLVVAGAGGGGRGQGGGGGAGGYLTSTGFAVTATGLTVIIGGGGAGSSTGGAAGTNGVNSVFSSITATGGGGGGSHSYPTAGPGSNGGSGGGGSPGSASGTGTNAGSASPSGQGNNGGQFYTDGASYGIGGGGGGAGAVGSNGVVNGPAGNGGIGLASSINGTSVYYAAGGGGGGDNRATNIASGSGGNGGGGAGGASAVAGTVNTGGGGGAGAYNGANNNGASGGSGIVIIRYLT